MVPVEVLLRLVCVVSCLVHDIPQIDQLVENGRLNVNILQHVQTVLRERQRGDVLDIVYRTMAGDYTLLEQHERDMGATLEEFHSQHVPRNWPAWCWRITQNYNPVRQETDEVSGRTDNGNVLDTESGGQDNQRYGNALRPRHHNMPHPSEHRHQKTRRPQVDQSTVHRSPSQEPDLHEPFFPVGNPSPPQCCLCGKRIQATQASRSVWSQIRSMIMGLNRENLQRFINEINRYDRGLLNFEFVQIHAFSAQEVIDNIILPSLQRWHPEGRKCILCLLNYLFQRSGLSNLANQVRMI